MINKLFKKEHSNETFALELTKKKFDEQWLLEGLKSDYIDINHKDKHGDTILTKYVKEGRYNAAEWLIKNGADVNLKNNDGKNALEIAVEKNNLPIVKGLLDFGKIDVNQKDATGRSLLQNVVVWGNHQMAKLLLKYGADINSVDDYGRIVLYDALAFGDRQFLRYLLSLDKLSISHIDDDGNTLMQYPEVEKNDSIAKDILVAGIDPTITKKGENSFLYNTMLRDDKDSESVFDVALDHGANVNARALSGNTILVELIYIASTLPKNQKEKRNLYLKRAKKMVAHHGNLNLLDPNGETILFHAIRLIDMELINFLLTCGIDANIQDSKGKPALEYAIYYGLEKLDLFLLLINHGANPKQKNKHGKCIYEVLNDILLHQYGTKIIDEKDVVSKIEKNGQYIEIVKKFLEINNSAEHVEKIEYLDSTGDPLFFKPLIYDHFTLYRVYIRFGFDVHAKNKANHNIFFEYVLKVFEKNNNSLKACENFQHNLTNLISSKIDKNYQDELGWTILHKVVGTNCDEKLFDILTKVVPFDYTIVDKLGRSVVHNAVWGNKKNIIKKIATHSKESINIMDNYNILPMTYAALLGSKEIVLEFLRLGSFIHTNKKIDPKALKKFAPMLKNLDKLTHDVEDISDLKNLQSVVDQVKKDFGVV
jgi:ankyrin repeat protein